MGQRHTGQIKILRLSRRFLTLFLSLIEVFCNRYGCLSQGHLGASLLGYNYYEVIDKTMKLPVITQTDYRRKSLPRMSLPHSTTPIDRHTFLSSMLGITCILEHLGNLARNPGVCLMSLSQDPR
jgi:hypothetical protein